MTEERRKTNDIVNFDTLFTLVGRIAKGTKSLRVKGSKSPFVQAFFLSPPGFRGVGWATLSQSLVVPKVT
jgi:hypothetical protein